MSRLDIRLPWYKQARLWSKAGPCTFGFVDNANATTAFSLGSRLTAVFWDCGEGGAVYDMLHDMFDMLHGMMVSVKNSTVRGNTLRAFLVAFVDLSWV